jgi:ribonuclease P/MRP protein subunit RPP40
LHDIEVKMPLLKLIVETNDNYGADFQEFAAEMHEWLSLVSLDSPRVKSTDKIDPFLSRYTPPGDPDTTDNLVKVTWTGFISPSWAHKNFVEILLAIPRKSWLSYYVGSFGATWNGEGKNSTILKVPDASNEYVLWEVS